MKDALGRLSYFHYQLRLMCGRYLYLLIDLLILLRKLSSFAFAFAFAFAYLSCSLGYPSGYDLFGVTNESEQIYCVGEKSSKTHSESSNSNAMI